MERHFLVCIFNLFNFCLYLNIGSEDAQTKFEIVDLLCIILRNACVDRLPHTCFCTCLILFGGKEDTKKTSGDKNSTNII